MPLSVTFPPCTKRVICTRIGDNDTVFIVLFENYSLAYRKGH